MKSDWCISVKDYHRAEILKIQLAQASFSSWGELPFQIICSMDANCPRMSLPVARMFKSHACQRLGWKASMAALYPICLRLLASHGTLLERWPTP